MYDYWTKLSDEDYALSLNKQASNDYLDNNTTSLTVVSVYTRAGFIKIIENPEMYPPSIDDGEGGETPEVGVTE